MAEEGSNTLATIHSINNSNQKTDIDVSKLISMKRKRRKRKWLHLKHF